MDSFLESHVPILEHFLAKIKPLYSIELGCGFATTPYLDSKCQMNLVFDSRYEYMSKVEDELDLENTNFNVYNRIEEVCLELKIFKNPYDIAVVSGPLPDRAVFAQKLLDTRCKCVILLDYEAESKIGYRTIRNPGNYDFRVFQNEETHVETGVYLLNYLSALKIKKHA